MNHDERRSNSGRKVSRVTRALTLGVGILALAACSSSTEAETEFAESDLNAPPYLPCSWGNNRSADGMSKGCSCYNGTYEEVKYGSTTVRNPPVIGYCPAYGPKAAEECLELEQTCYQQIQRARYASPCRWTLDEGGGHWYGGRDPRQGAVGSRYNCECGGWIAGSCVDTGDRDLAGCQIYVGQACAAAGVSPVHGEISCHGSPANTPDHCDLLCDCVVRRDSDNKGTDIVMSFGSVRKVCGYQPVQASYDAAESECKRYVRDNYDPVDGTKNR